MAKFIGYDYKDENGLEEFLRAHWLKQGAYDVVDDLTKRGEAYIRLYAPAYTGELLRRIDRTVPMPSVSAAGLTIEAQTGVRQGARYPLYAHGGTGLYKMGQMGGVNPIGIPTGSNLIRPRGNRPMTFQKRGEPRRFRWSTKGQKPNPFMLYAWQQLVPYARGRIRRMVTSFRRGT